ncbi:hypothetical protein SAMD00019534_073260 [Acytostelium subglobosum LB1]|uniref:hypothetical protein n=1 Tax=Acytostelium subglobosum LB1 TaxID=1410327 RepID=UPI000644856E|nr:hypothetical protein SAMD00019534_073260 [Acytostelium subglobosum LB1]GAM24151.1 hypothetical protein SAMD00019534_073260 [Acytostelium subglobosum LB1]|eukprot:XP_012753187.1 hypothetical protein SAMD00019534_073260 [Acytostelium subglobosum LB1]
MDELKNYKQTDEDKELLDSMRKLIKTMSGEEEETTSRFADLDPFNDPTELERVDELEPMFDLTEELSRLEEIMRADASVSEESAENLADLVKVQTEFELQATETARNNYRSLVNDTSLINRASGMKPIKDVMYQFYTPLIDKTKIELDRMRKSESEELLIDMKTRDDNLDKIFEVLPSARLVLDSLPHNKVALISLNQLMSALLIDPMKGATFNAVIESIGEALLAEYQLAVIKEHDRKLYKHITKPYNGLVLSVNRVQNEMRKRYHNLASETKIVTQLGNFMLKIVMDTCQVNKYSDSDVKGDLVPAFYRDQTYENGRKVYVVKCHESIFEMIDEGHFLREAMNARLLPMVTRPQPWVNPHEGCYMSYPNFIMRAISQTQRTSLYQVDISNIYEGLNILGSLPWKTNKKVVDVIVEAWEAGGGIAELPSRFNFEQPVAADPEKLTTDLEMKKQHSKNVKKIKTLNANLHSLRCDTVYKLNVAKQLHDYKFYFPHNIDFRGRSYPIPPHLNHMGSDLCRSMLRFAEAKPLGARGLQWLRVQVANVYGVDKVSFEDRIAFTEEHMDDIFDSADNPLKGRKWWLKADSPWQTLAACIELTDALRSPKPEEFLSSLPIHQDGTCNGLQHYAALGGDEMGGLKVNLLPSPKPQDVYSGVAVMVSKLVHDDALTGNKLALILDGKIERKIIKQTVMTSVYGVTYVGARQQIENALADKYNLTDDVAFAASSYIAKLTFKSLDQMFLGARSIMSWLAQCAGTISRDTGECVSWYTPLGLPVVQPYRKGGKQRVRTLVLDFQMTDDDDSLPVDSRKQRSAFPPNFIHSLDSTHMFLTAIQCDKRNITFASVHDSFWTHACTIDQMNALLRHQFVELHSQPLLERLREWFIHRYPTVKIPPLPKRGQLDLSKVRESKYFFH